MLKTIGASQATNKKPKKWGFVVDKGKLYARNKLDRSASRFLLGPIFSVSLDTPRETTPIGWVPIFYIRVDFEEFNCYGRYEYSGSVAKQIAVNLCGNPQLGFAFPYQRVLSALTAYLAKRIEELSRISAHRLYLTKYGHPIKQSI